MRGETDSVLGPPPDVGAHGHPYDPNWYEKIERAMRAREIGEKLLKNARTRYSPHEGDKNLNLREKNLFVLLAHDQQSPVS